MDLEISYHPQCGREFSPLSPTYFMINHLYVRTNSIMKIKEEKYPHVNKIGEYPIVTKLKFSGWGVANENLVFLKSR